MRDLVPADLSLLDDEPRIRDLALAEALGFDRSRKIRELIASNLEEIELHGPSPRRGAMVEIGSGARRAVQEYWLNEAQALLVCMFARTARAVEVRRQVIGVYLAWRRGRAVEGARAPAALPSPRPPFLLDEAARRLGPADVQALALTLAPVWKNGRRPKFWSDFEVRVFLVETHRQVQIAEAREECARRFGPQRTPSTSAIGRFWVALDAARLLPKAA